MTITRLGWASFALGLVTACGGGAPATDGGTDGGGIPEGCDHFVAPSDDDQTAIQTALVAAGDGDTVCLAAGEFTLTDPIEVSNLSDFTLKGAGIEATTLNFEGQDAGGTGIDMMNMTRVVVSDLAIRDAAGNGLRISASDQVVVRRVSAGWTHEEASMNGKYAIYPVSSSNVLVDESEAFGSADAGIYVGQTESCVVRNSHAHGNVAGIEIENSSNCEVFGNQAEGNVGGILVFELPDLARHGGGTLVHDNTITDNNLYNFAEGGIVTNVPRGTGMFLLAANDVEVRNNTISGNEGFGLAVVSWGTAEALGVGEATDPTYDPWAERVDVHDNTFENNGTMPGGDGSDSDDPLWQVRALLIAQGFDVSGGLETIGWDGLSKDGAAPGDVLCLRDNGDATFRNLDIVNLVNMTSPMSTTDASPHDCAQPPRDAVTLPFEG
jgi:parallel beta-helix repeat protein